MTNLVTTEEEIEYVGGSEPNSKLSDACMHQHQNQKTKKTKSFKFTSRTITQTT